MCWRCLQCTRILSLSSRRQHAAICAVPCGLQHNQTTHVRLYVQDRLYATLANKELTKKMSPTNAKALNTMRQRLRKHNPQYSEQMEKFRANPESEEEPDRCFPTSSRLGQHPFDSPASPDSPGGARMSTVSCLQL